jgi:hypothetical protein
MKALKIITIITLAVVAVSLVTATAFAFLVNRTGTYTQYGTNTRIIYPYGGNGYGYGGMMGGGMMGGYGGGYSYSPPIYVNGTYVTSLNVTTAETIATNYLSAVNNPDLAVKEIEEYSQNFYVQYYEKSTGIGAFEMLVDKYSGSIYPEMGPNMMWNAKYGMMSGMMGFFAGTPTASMPVSADQAKANAQQWLNNNIAGATVGEVFPFYGYYHVMAMVNGTNYGMMSVNGYSGQVWYHTWHGTFIQAIDVS